MMAGPAEDWVKVQKRRLPHQSAVVRTASGVSTIRTTRARAAAPFPGCLDTEPPCVSKQVWAYPERGVNCPQALAHSSVPVRITLAIVK